MPPTVACALKRWMNCPAACPSSKGAWERKPCLPESGLANARGGHPPSFTSANVVSLEPRPDEEAIFGEDIALVQEWRDLKRTTILTEAKAWTGQSMR